MGRYTGPSCRLCRQVGEKLFLKGERCYTPKCAIEKRRQAPGSRRATRRRRLSDYATRLREKQKVRYAYGLTDTQFRRYMGEAQKQPGVTGQYLLQLMERRLDNVVYRFGLAGSRKEARQLVTHGHFSVNGRRLDIPSAILRPGDVVAFRERSQKLEFVKALAGQPPARPVPPWLSLDANTLTGRVVSLPEVTDIDLRLDPRLIVEFYSR